MKKTNKSKWLCLATALLLALIIGLFPVMASAEEQYSVTDTDVEADSQLGEENLPTGENQSYPTDAQDETSDTDEIGESENASGDSEATQEASPSEKERTNIFTAIFGLLKDNADKIFSILAFIGTVIVGYGYKSGLIPMLKDALGKLRGSIDKASEESKSLGDMTGEGLLRIEDRLDGVTDSLSNMSERLSLVESGVMDHSALLCEREKMRLVMLSQIDMLYAIFMTSALPQYQKEEVGLKIQDMKKELMSYEEEEK